MPVSRRWYRLAVPPRKHRWAGGHPVWLHKPGVLGIKADHQMRAIYSANVPSDLSLLAFGIPPAREAELAGGMPKVPKGQGLGRLARWAYILFVPYVGNRA